MSLSLFQQRIHLCVVSSRAFRGDVNAIPYCSGFLHLGDLVVKADSVGIGVHRLRKRVAVEAQVDMLPCSSKTFKAAAIFVTRDESEDRVHSVATLLK